MENEVGVTLCVEGRRCLVASSSRFPDEVVPTKLEEMRMSFTTFSDGCLGSHNDEERSEMRYVMRIARPRESSKL